MSDECGSGELVSHEERPSAADALSEPDEESVSRPGAGKSSKLSTMASMLQWHMGQRGASCWSSSATQALQQHRCTLRRPQGCVRSTGLTGGQGL